MEDKGLIRRGFVDPVDWTAARKSRKKHDEAYRAFILENRRDYWFADTYEKRAEAGRVVGEPWMLIPVHEVLSFPARMLRKGWREIFRYPY
jgi:hypothetical protein